MGHAGFSSFSSLIRLEATVNMAVAVGKDNPRSTVESLHHLCADINEQVANPLAHALHMAGGQFNELSTKQRIRIAKSMWDSQLVCWLEDTEESLTQLFPSDVMAAMEAAMARRTDGLLLLARRTVSTAPPPKCGKLSNSIIQGVAR